MTHKVWCRSSAFLAAAVAIECLRHLHWHVQPAQHGVMHVRAWYGLTSVRVCESSVSEGGVITGVLPPTHPYHVPCRNIICFAASRRGVCDTRAVPSAQDTATYVSRAPLPRGNHP